MNGYERAELGIKRGEKPSRFEKVALPVAALGYCGWYYWTILQGFLQLFQ